MSIEANLSSIAKSLELIAQALSNMNQLVTTPQVVTKVEPVVVATPVVAPVTVAPVAAPVMPAAPVFTPAPAIAVAPSGATVAVAPPFADKSAMMDFVLSSYKALGQEKGAKIQDVLNGMGVQNVNDVPVERWAELKAGIDALKG